MFFRKGIPRSFHVHLVEQDSKEEIDHLDFLQALNNDLQLSREYRDLKVGLAGNYSTDRATYGENKSAFIHRALASYRNKQI